MFHAKVNRLMSEWSGGVMEGWGLISPARSNTPILHSWPVFVRFSSGFWFQQNYLIYFDCACLTVIE